MLHASALEEAWKVDFLYETLYAFTMKSIDCNCLPADFCIVLQVDNFDEEQY